jgi:hypothetical protein
VAAFSVAVFAVIAARSMIASVRCIDPVCQTPAHQVSV